MQGNAEMIEWLNKCLSIDITAVDIYFVQGKMCEDWGLKKLEAAFLHERDHEQAHAARSIERILFLEGTPVLTERKRYEIGKDIPAQLKNNLAYELEGAEELRQAIAFAESIKDFVSRDLLEELLKDTEEDHIFWLETQLGLIEKVGLQNYLQSQM